MCIPPTLPCILYYLKLFSYFMPVVPVNPDSCIVTSSKTAIFNCNFTTNCCVMVNYGIQLIICWLIEKGTESVNDWYIWIQDYLLIMSATHLNSKILPYQQMILSMPQPQGVCLLYECHPSRVPWLGRLHLLLIFHLLSFLILQSTS